MTETERKALALVNEMARELGWDQAKEIYAEGYTRNKALFRAIERHEAFRQEVSDAVTALLDRFLGDSLSQGVINGHLHQFIIRAPKPDPLVEAFGDADLCARAGHTKADYAENLRAAIEARGGKIVWGEG